MAGPIPVPYSRLPGAIFSPSPEELLKYYLSGKNNCNTEPAEGYGFIKELDLYNRKPFDLPEVMCYRYGHQKTHWFFYTPEGVEESEDGRRMAISGYWKRVGGTVDVTDDKGREVLGTRAEFRFYLGTTQTVADRTDWFMHEYALLQHLKVQASFVLCRVFVQSCAGNSFPQKILTCAKESFPEVRHVGIQHGGFLLPILVDAKVQVDNSIDGKSDASGYPSRLNSELDDPAPTCPVSAATFESLSGILHSELVSSQLTPELLSSILDENFMELDDLM